MRIGLLTIIVLGAAAVAAPLAGADPGQSGFTVRAVTGSDQLPVTGVSVGVANCAAGPVLTTLTTGTDGTVTQPVAPGCYQISVTTTPGGCELAGGHSQQVNVAPDAIATATFQFRCA
ncbi:hypothetical protein [Nocardia sp. NPDC052566]|uniref:hypothetical protein n=1 Tax=Nocardia sp. NPDC052566 TaxID=3364330 RepID=UPI0037C7FAB8